MTDPTHRRRLGRGLEALLGPSTIAEARADGSLSTLSMGAIRPNPYQPRHVFDETALEELKESLRAVGLLQPIIVRPAGDGYELIAGERRWRAAERLGWKEIGAVVREVDDRTLLTLALVENLQRDALSPIDEAKGYQRLVAEFSVSQNELGEMVGRERSTVANALRLLKLPEDVQDLVHSEKLSTGHARALLQLKDESEMSRLGRESAARGLSVRELEALVRGDRPPQRRVRKAAGDSRAPQGPDVRRVEDALRRRLKTDVFVSQRGKGGKVTISFYSNDDLARLLHVILGEPFGG